MLYNVLEDLNGLPNYIKFLNTLAGCFGAELSPAIETQRNGGPKRCAFSEVLGFFSFFFHPDGR